MKFLSGSCCCFVPELPSDQWNRTDSFCSTAESPLCLLALPAEVTVVQVGEFFSSSAWTWEIKSWLVTIHPTSLKSEQKTFWEDLVYPRGQQNLTLREKTKVAAVSHFLDETIYSRNKRLHHLLYSLATFFSVFSQFTVPCCISECV